MFTLALGKFSDESGRYVGSRMMGDGNSVDSIHFVLAVITWLTILAVLIALARWLWLKGDKEKKSR